MVVTNCMEKLSSYFDFDSTLIDKKSILVRGSMIAIGSAILIIGLVGSLGLFPGSSIGWIAISLGSGTFALNLALGNFKNRKVELLVTALFTAVIITLGALGGAGVLSATQVGMGLFATPILLLCGGTIVWSITRLYRMDHEKIRFHFPMGIGRL